MALNVFQGKDAVLAFDRNGFVPFVCAENFTLEVIGASQSAFTEGDGVWAKNKYSGLSYKLTLSGLLKYDLSNFTSFDIFQNMIGFSELHFQMQFHDDAGDIKSFEGNVIIDANTFNVGATSLSSGSFSFTGDGPLMFYDGIIPCPSSILSITVTGQTASDGIIHVAYTYNGVPYQVKYQIDSTGPWTYALVGAAITIPNLPNGSHTIKMYPICSNNYLGTALVQSFIKTTAMTCSLVCTGITATVTGSNVQFSISFNNAIGVGSSFRYATNDGTGYGAYTTVSGPLTANPVIINRSFPNGNFTIQVIPTCANGVDGTGATQTFTVSSGTSLSTINYSFTAVPGGSPLFKIFVNGVPTISLTATASGSFSVPNGATVLTQIQVSFIGRDQSLLIQDTTTSSVLYNHSHITSASPETDQFTFTANGDTYSISGTISP